MTSASSAAREAAITRHPQTATTWRSPIGRCRLLDNVIRHRTARLRPRADRPRRTQWTRSVEPRGIRLRVLRASGDRHEGSAILQRLSISTSRSLNRLQDIGGLRQDRVFELGVVGDRRIERADASDRRVEILEQLAGDRARRFRRRSRTSADPRARRRSGSMRLTCAAIASQSYGAIVRRSSTATLMPSFSA